jgi:hypothetical protein
VPTSGGVNTTWSVQLWFDGSAAGQLLVCVNVPSGGEIAMLATLTDAAPSFTRVTLSGLLLVFWL